MKISRDLSISSTTIQYIIYQFQKTNSDKNTWHRDWKSKSTIWYKNLLLRLVKWKSKLTFKTLWKDLNDNNEQKFIKQLLGGTLVN